MTYLCTNGAVHIDKVNMSELFLDLLDLRIGVGSSQKTLQSTDGVLEVRGLESLCALTEGSLLESERDK